MIENHGNVKRLVKNLNWNDLNLSSLQKELVDLDQVFDKSADAIILINNEFNILRVNPTFREMAGINNMEVRGLKCYDLLFSPICHKEACPLKRIMNGEEEVEFEAKRTFTNQTWTPTLLSIKPLRSPDGEIIGIIEFIRDVSKLQESKNALKESEHKFKTYIEKSPDGIVITDVNGRYVEVNDAFCSLLGYSRRELLEASITDCTVPEDLVKLQATKGKTSHISEVTQIKKNGEQVSVELHGAALDNGQYIGFLRDVTRRRLAEEALRESELNYHLILNGISDGVILYEISPDLSFKIIKANRSFLRTIGLPEEQVIGKFIQEVFPAHLTNLIIIHYLTAAKTGEVVTRTGTEIGGSTFSLTYIPIFSETGQCTHLIATSRDITPQRNLEEHMQKIEKLESVGLLAGGIAHDFNNFLTVILGNISLARMRLEKNQANEDDLDKITNLLCEAERASLQARGLTQQLLTFAKGGTPILKPSSLGQLLQESVGFALSGSNVRCQFSIPEDLWTVEIDEGQINQVVNNLVINADQAMPNGGIIKISAENIIIAYPLILPLEEGRYVKVTIVDTGIGIGREHLDKIFDPYFSTKQKGSGLGLATSYSIVMKHNGFITVDSELGKGTTFFLYLPACDKTPATNAPGVIEIKNNRVKGRILVMDDDQMVRYVLEAMLEYLGYETSSVQDGQEAIEKYMNDKLSGKQYDAVIMDLTIPGGLGGQDTINKLIEMDPQVKAIVSSGYSNDPVMADFRDFGFQAVLVKPFSVEQIGEVLKMVIPQTGGEIPQT